MSDWKKRLEIAKKKHPEGSGDHAWFFFKDDKFECCAWCGIVKRKDGKNKPCLGKTKISFRSDK